MTTERQFYLLRCASGQERTAAEWLEGMGYLAMSPLMRTYRRNPKTARCKERYVEIIRPVTPTYLIAEFSRYPDLGRIMVAAWKRPSFGIKPVANADARLIPVRRSDVDQLRQMDEAGAFNHQRPTIREGGRVTVEEMPHLGSPVVLEVRDDEIRVRFSMLGQDSIWIDRRKAAPVPEGDSIAETAMIG